MAAIVIHRMTYETVLVNRTFCLRGDKIRLGMSAKDTRLTLRIASDLKKKLELVAASEGRSVAQICDAFLRAGLAGYQKEGTKYVRRFLSRHESET
jgi:hypothetical protein